MRRGSSAAPAGTTRAAVSGLSRVPAAACVFCYILSPVDRKKEGRVTYVGFTTNPFRRLRQHNGEIKGGAKRTRKHRPWRICAVVGGIPTKFDGLSLEYALQHPYRARKTRDHLKAALGPAKPRERGGPRSVRRKLLEALGILYACEPFSGYGLTLHVAEPRYMAMLQKHKIPNLGDVENVCVISDEFNTLKRDVIEAKRLRKEARARSLAASAFSAVSDGAALALDANAPGSSDSCASSSSCEMIDLCSEMMQSAELAADSGEAAGALSSDDDDDSLEMLDLCTADGSVGEVGVLADDGTETDMSIIDLTSP